MRVGYCTGYGKCKMRFVHSIEACYDKPTGPYLLLTFKPEPGVDNGEVVKAVGMFWVDNIPVFYLPENW